MDRWFTWVDNKVYGPYVPEQLAEFIRPATLLCKEGGQDWRKAEDIPELGFILGGLPLDPPPNVGWLIRKKDETDVLGPYPKLSILQMITDGYITELDSIKHSDWDEWEQVGNTKLIGGQGPAILSPDPPNPMGFPKAVQDASDQDLLKEFNTNYLLYARHERKILKEELLKRGLIKQTLDSHNP